MTERILTSDTFGQPVPSLGIFWADNDWTEGTYNDFYGDNITLPGDDPQIPYERDGYPYPSMYSWSHIAAAAVVVATIMLVIVAGNALVIVAIAVDRSLKGLQNWFIASLAVSDLFVGAFIMPLSLANELMGYWPFGDVLCQLWLSTDVLLCTASILNLVLISLDRYWSITRAVAYVRARTRRRAVAMITAVWLVSMVICLPPLIGWKGAQPTRFGYPLCVLSEEPGYVLYSTVGSFYLPLVIMILVYFKIYLAAKRHARKNLKKSQGTSNGKPLANTSKTADNVVITNPRSQREALASPCKETSSELDLFDYYHHEDSPKADEEEEDEEEECGVRSELRVRRLEDEVTTASGNNSSDKILSQRNLLFVTDADDSTADLSPSTVHQHPRDEEDPGRRTESLPDGRLLSNRHIDRRCTQISSLSSEEVILPETSHATPKRLWKLLSHPTNILRSDAQSSSYSNRTSSIGIIGRTSVDQLGSSRQRSLAATVFYFNLNIRHRTSLPIRRSRRNEDPTNNIIAQEKFKRRIARAKERRATVVLGIVMASFVGCWLPFFFMYPMTMLVGLHVPEAVFAVMFWLGYVNSALNPIIYTIFNPDFRLAFRRLLTVRHTQGF